MAWCSRATPRSKPPGRRAFGKWQVVDADGQTIIAVRRTGLNAHQKARLALYDNRSAELAEGWDAEVLRAMQADGVKVDDLFHPDEWADLCGDLEGRGGTHRRGRRGRGAADVDSAW